MNVEFMKAVKQNQLEQVKLIVMQGINSIADNNFALCWAASNGHLEIVKFLCTLPDAYNNYAFIWAAGNGHLEIVKFLSNLPDVNPGEAHKRACRWASKNGHHPAHKFLCTHLNKY